MSSSWEGELRCCLVAEAGGVGQDLLLPVERKCSDRFENGLFNLHVDVLPYFTNLVDDLDGYWAQGQPCPPGDDNPSFHFQLLEWGG